MLFLSLTSANDTFGLVLCQPPSLLHLLVLMADFLALASSAQDPALVSRRVVLPDAGSSSYVAAEAPVPVCSGGWGVCASKHGP